MITTMTAAAVTNGADPLHQIYLTLPRHCVRQAGQPSIAATGGTYS